MTYPYETHLETETAVESMTETVEFWETAGVTETRTPLSEETFPPRFQFESHPVEVADGKMTVDLGAYSDEEINEILSQYVGYISVWVSFCCEEHDASTIPNWGQLTGAEKIAIKESYYTPLIRSMAYAVGMPVIRERYDSSFDEVIYREISEYRQHEGAYTEMAYSEFVQSVRVELVIFSDESLAVPMQDPVKYDYSTICDHIGIYDETYTGVGVKIAIY